MVFRAKEEKGGVWVMVSGCLYWLCNYRSLWEAFFVNKMLSCGHDCAPFLFKHFKWLENPWLYKNCWVLCYCGADRGQAGCLLRQWCKLHVLPAGLLSAGSRQWCCTQYQYRTDCRIERPGWGPILCQRVIRFLQQVNKQEKKQNKEVQLSALIVYIFWSL